MTKKRRNYNGGGNISRPPNCAHHTDGWRLDVCRRGSYEEEEEEDCDSLDLTGESPLHLSPLPPCSRHRITLHSSPK